MLFTNASLTATHTSASVIGSANRFRDIVKNPFPTIESIACFITESEQQHLSLDSLGYRDGLSFSSDFPEAEVASVS